MHPAFAAATATARSAGKPLALWLADAAAEGSTTLSGAVRLAAGLHVVPEFLGNRAPFADPHARAVIAGIGMETDVASLVAFYVAGVTSIGYGLRQIIEAQAQKGAPIQRIMISGGAGKLDLVRQLLADSTGKPVVGAAAAEPVLLGSAMLGAVAGGLFEDVSSAMSAMSSAKMIFDPASGGFETQHRARYDAFQRLQSVAREIVRNA